MILLALVALAAAVVVAQPDCTDRQRLDVNSNTCVCKDGFVFDSSANLCVLEPAVTGQRDGSGSAFTMTADTITFKTYDSAAKDAASMTLAQLIASIADKATNGRVDTLSAQVSQNTAALQSAATSAQLSAVSTAVTAKADSGALGSVSTAVTAVDSRVTAVNNTLLNLRLDPLTEVNSGRCNMTQMAATRLNTMTGRTEACLMGVVDGTYMWTPVGAPRGCFMVNETGGCLYCQEGAVLSGNRCIIPADVLHYTFENSLRDLSGNAYDGELVNNQYSLVTAPNAPEGSYAMQLSGGWMTVPPLNLAKDTLTLMAFVRFDAFTNWARIMDFGNGPATDNVLLGHKANTADLIFEMYRMENGNTASYPLTGLGFFDNCLGAWCHVAITVNSTGFMTAYKNGVHHTGVQGIPVPEIYRQNNFIGKSNWDADGPLNGQIDDFRVYSLDMDADSIRNVACGGSYGVCDGLLGSWRFNGDFLDSSINRWHGLPNNSAIQANLFVSGPWPGELALRVDGVDDLVTLPPRRFGGAFSVCASVKMDRVAAWTRVIDCGNGPGMDNIILANVANSLDLRFEVWMGNQNPFPYTVANAWWPALGAYVHTCATVDANGAAHVYMNGLEVGPAGGGRAAVPPLVTRSNCYIAESNWAADQSLDGSLDDIRFYSRALTQQEVQNQHCRNSSSRLDCVGLLARFDFEGAALDISGSGWVGHVIRGRQSEQLFTAPGAAMDGSQALQLLGQDAYIRLQPRQLGGPLSVCADVRFNAIISWGRIIDFGVNAADTNIIIGNFQETTDLVLELWQGAETYAAPRWTNFWADAINNWVSMCVTVDAAGMATAYKNGVKVGDTQNTGRAIPFAFRTRNFIGNNNWNWDGKQTANALMDNLRIYHYALSAADVQSLYNAKQQ